MDKVVVSLVDLELVLDCLEDKHLLAAEKYLKVIIEEAKKEGVFRK